ncbi:MAG: tripartite tricarboxylate transporter substrate binding protein [Burkholderiales bacterium]|nr:tripartite tricarboxylate transporter substrate binding protein [Burkholderiales bacterium]
MSFAAAAQDYPTKPIRIVVPVAAGGLTDILAREIGARLSTRLNQAVVIENKAGAGGIIGMEFAAKLPADGYNLLMAYPGPVVVNPWIYRNLPYDPAKDFVPVHLLASYAVVLAVNSTFPAKTVREFIDHVKANPGKINYGSAGNATLANLTMELFKRSAGIDLVHVPYKGAAPAMNDLVAGHTAAVFDSVALVRPQVEAGRIRALGISSRQRSSAMPDVPPIAESGVPDFEALGWYGIMAPKGVPAPIIARLSRELSAILKEPDVRAKLQSQALEVIDGDPVRFATFLAEERDRWQRVVKDAGIKAD